MSQFQDLVGEMLTYWFPGEPIYENYRPPWLFGLELDFYFPNLRFAVEINGAQHYLFVPSMQGEPERYKEQRERDRRKHQIMRARGERIIVIRSFKGIYGHMRKIFPERAFPVVPKDLQVKIKKYRQRAHEGKKSSVAFKVKKDRLLGVNKSSAAAIKSEWLP